MAINYVKKINRESDIFWGLVVLEVALALGISTEYIFAATLLYILFVFANSRKIIIPRIQSLKPYLIFIAYGTVVGLAQYGLRSVSRSLYYILPTVVLILLGYILSIAYPHKSIQKTICLLAVAGTIYSFYNFFIHFSEIKGIDNIRIYMGAMNNEATVAVVILFTNCFLFKKVLFSRVVDFLLFAVIAVKIIMSLGRVTVGEAVIGITVAFIVSMFIDTNRRYIRGIVAMAFLVIIFAITFTLLPEDATSSFSEKIENSSVEVNSDLEFNSLQESVEHWRGYEIQEARNQWKNGNGFEIVFGQGIGQTIAVRFIPPAWNANLLDGNRLPILHNSYYYMLVIGGLFGVFALIYLMAGGFILLFKHRRSKYKVELAVLAAVSASILFNTYFTRGIITQNLILGWPLLYGALNMTFNRMDDDDKVEEETEEK